MTTEFYRNVVTVTILSDRPIDGMDIDTLLYQCTDGDMVMGAMDLATTQIDRARMDQELILAGSDPTFFSPDDDDDD